MPGELDPRTREQLMEEGVSPQMLRRLDIPAAQQPATASGIAALRNYEVPRLLGSGTRGFVLSSNVIEDFPKNQAQTQAAFFSPEAGKDTHAHEYEHLLARQGLGSSVMINKKFDELMGEGGSQARAQFVRAAVEAAPYLKEKYGISNAYFDPRMLRQGGTALYEQLASLAGYEAANGVDLTKDPELRKTLFKDKAVRETYNAITGLRQTRLDARDLPPYTRQPEVEPKQGMWDRIKRAAKDVF